MKPGINLRRIEAGQIFAVNEIEGVRHVHVTVQINVTVGRVVIPPVEIQELLIGQGRDHGRIAAGLKAVSGIREKRIHGFALEHVLIRRKGAFHFTVHHTVQRDGLVRAFQLIVPPLLPENVLLMVNVRIEHGVQVDMHEVPEVGVIGTRNGVHRLVRIGDRI